MPFPAGMVVPSDCRLHRRRRGNHGLQGIVVGVLHVGMVFFIAMIVGIALFKKEVGDTRSNEIGIVDLHLDLVVLSLIYSFQRCLAHLTSLSPEPLGPRPQVVLCFLLAILPMTQY